MPRSAAASGCNSTSGCSACLRKDGKARCWLSQNSVCFVLVNTGGVPVFSDRLLTSVAYRAGAGPASYVLEGSIVMQLRGAEPVTVKAGEGFYEGPNDVHIVGRSASDSKPAKFVVFLVKNQGVPALLPAK